MPPAYPKPESALALLRDLGRLLTFWRRSPGLAGFLDFYREDHGVPLSPLERERFPSFQKCQACSLCTFTCTAVKEGTAPPAFEPKSIPLGLARSAYDAECFTDAWLPCAQCRACTVECPVGVPLHLMVADVVARAKG